MQITEQIARKVLKVVDAGLTKGVGALLEWLPLLETE